MIFPLECKLIKSSFSSLIFDFIDSRWSNNYEAELYVYGESYGVIWDIAVNRSNPADDLVVVGAFDTVSKLSQVQYCGVGVWTGLAFNKVTLSPVLSLLI
jgi:alpha-acetolactate decarboxylase